MTRALRLTLILGTMLLGLFAFFMPEREPDGVHGCSEGY